MPASHMTRRDALKTLFGAAAVTTFGGISTVAIPGAAVTRPDRQRLLRFIHMTDTHVGDDVRAVAEMPIVFELINSMTDPPDMIMHGGDIINTPEYQSLDGALAQKDEWVASSAGNEIPIRYAIGNHDVWGLDLAETSPHYDPTNPLWGKGFYQEFFEPELHYTFDLNGVRFIVLDSVHEPIAGVSRFYYTGKLDAAQMTWLSQQLQTTPNDMPTVIVTHFPTTAASTLFQPNGSQTAYWVTRRSADGGSIIMPDNLCHMDCFEITDLIRQHQPTAVCLSGHVHHIDRVEGWYRPTSICGGAVCGRWWKGQHLNNPPCFGVFDIYDDGTFDQTLVVTEPPDYSWVSPQSVPSGLMLR